MKLNSGKYLSILVLSTFAISCNTARYDCAVKDEQTGLHVKTDPGLINYKALKKQMVPTFEQRAGMTRGFLFSEGAISFATNAIKQMIEKEKEKYTANYSFAETNMYFYDQLSTTSAFDPLGLQFKGFSLVRTFTNDMDKLDTAFIANFVLDTTNTDEIFNNSIFRLRLKDLKLFYTKAKMLGKNNTINMDIEITFNTSYVNEAGQLFDNVQLGKFYFSLREAPLDRDSPSYKSYYDSLSNRPLEGRSFIVPRSFGYYTDQNGKLQKSFSEGVYTINANVTESSENKFVTKLLFDNSDNIIDAVGNKAQSILN